MGELREVFNKEIEIHKRNKEKNTINEIKYILERINGRLEDAEE